MAACMFVCMYGRIGPHRVEQLLGLCDDVALYRDEIRITISGDICKATFSYTRDGAQGSRGDLGPLARPDDHPAVPLELSVSVSFDNIVDPFEATSMAMSLADYRIIYNIYNIKSVLNNGSI